MILYFQISDLSFVFMGLNLAQNLPNFVHGLLNSQNLKESDV